MKTVTEQNFYVLLGVEFDASSFEISRAYRESYQLYQEESLATYSLFSRAEREDILVKLEEAFSTLIDERKRYRYDQSLIGFGIPGERINSLDKRKRILITQDFKLSTNNTVLQIREELKALVSSNSVIQEILNHDVLRGKDLKRIREELRVSLETIAEMTKVRIIYLRAIENDESEKVPSGTFLRSFLKAYGQSVGLDPDLVASRYLKRMGD